MSTVIGPPLAIARILRRSASALSADEEATLSVWLRATGWLPTEAGWIDPLDDKPPVMDDWTTLGAAKIQTTRWAVAFLAPLGWRVGVGGTRGGDAYIDVKEMFRPVGPITADSLLGALRLEGVNVDRPGWN
jgi:hypothetical protein